MITNKLQYSITLAQLEKFNIAILSLDNENLEDLLIKAQLDALKSQRDDLLDEINQFDYMQVAKAIAAVEESDQNFYIAWNHSGKRWTITIPWLDVETADADIEIAIKKAFEEAKIETTVIES